jgi:uncharacterized Fe-S center protein
MGQFNKEKRSKVFMTSSVSPAGLLAVYNALGRKAGNKTGVKISTGEPGGQNFLAPALIKDLVRLVDGVIVECNTAYGGKRDIAAAHREAANDHGFTAIAPVDILDEEGDLRIPVSGGSHLKEDVVGSHFTDYDFYLILSHFKGHTAAGFGGALKNMSIGFASPSGKALIHSAGRSAAAPVTDWGIAEHDEFLESMAEAAKAVADKMGGRILYINVMNNLSVDCDCSPNPAEPDMRDIGILASLDPVALDKACVDFVYAAPDGISLIERMESRNGIHTIYHAARIGVGNLDYELVAIEK